MENHKYKVKNFIKRHNNSQTKYFQSSIFFNFLCEKRHIGWRGATRNKNSVDNNMLMNHQVKIFCFYIVTTEIVIDVSRLWDYNKTSYLWYDTDLQLLYVIFFFKKTEQSIINWLKQDLECKLNLFFDYKNL